MRRLLQVAALIGVGMAASAWGQRGGARGGGVSGVSAGRGAASVGGGFAAGRQFSYGASRTTGGGGLPALRAGSGYAGRRPVYGSGGKYRSPYVGIPYGGVAVYGYPGYGGLGFGDTGYGDTGLAGYSSSDQQAVGGAGYGGGGYGGAGYAGGAAQQSSGLPDTDPNLRNDSAAYTGTASQEGAGRGAYRAAYAPSQPAAAQAPVNEDAVTLIFKDGRAPEQIHNYLLTRTTLYVQDGRQRQVAVVDLDLAATAKVNKDAGVAFQLPEAR